ncbi:uncharacterized protein BJ212DRAFT_1271301 [Suillus subaureus]|uniref:Uncharacterized protein n=1 Tax=Suillus subaureus TaxID=48587 RepID=A0A9P7JDR7_9AGAM|nr:uncharacterized protein BJ212DRAFT_1271301 [Suillus subaureus]KAG1816665.1 hypothetical protein BJ212DRAFT_1271301 [Suillus subaureus]
MIIDYGMDVELQPYSAPPGEEGLDMSHAGGEFEAFKGLAREIAGINGYCYVDPHTHTDCIENETNHWNIQMDCLVEAYLDYHHHGSEDGMPNCNGIPAPSPSNDTQHVLLSKIELIDIFSMY